MNMRWPEPIDDDPDSADDAIRPFGIELRTLIRDLATPLANKCVVGLSFRVSPESQRLVFAEVRDVDQQGGFLDERATNSDQSRHRLPANDAFIELIEQSAATKERRSLGQLDVQRSNEALVVRPLLAVFGSLKFDEVPDRSVATPWDKVSAELDGVFVEGFALGSPDSAGCTLYVAYHDDDRVNKSDLEEHLAAFRFVLPLVANLVREAVFFAAVVTREDSDDKTHGETIEELQRILDRLLPDEMPAFGTRQRVFLRGMLHPVFGSTLPLSYDSPKLEDFPASGVPLAPFNAIQTAVTLRYERTLSGSLRSTSGAPILVEVVPRHVRTGGAGPLPYKAVVKSTTRSEVLLEQRGLTRLWGYYNRIGRFLPQNPLHFPYSDDNGAVRFATMTPHVGNTDSLHEVAMVKWSKDRFPRYQYFVGIFNDLANFIDSIGNSKERYISPVIPFQEAFAGAESGPARRRKKLLKKVQWPTCIPRDAAWLRIVGSKHTEGDLNIVNPRWVIERMARDPNWAVNKYPQELKVKERIYAHGDLHCGNVLVEAGKQDGLCGRIIVLDFDYVGQTKSEHVDTATLECSFLMSVFRGLSNTFESSVWDQLIVPALLVRWRPSPYRERFENNRFVFDLDNVLERLPFSDSTCPSRSACRAVAMLRLLASHYSSELLKAKHLEDASGALWAAWLMAGLCLSDLFPPKALNGDSGELNLRTAFGTTWPS